MPGRRGGASGEAKDGDPMPKAKHNELLAGLFVVVALALGVGIVLWMGLADVFTTVREVSFYIDVPQAGSVGLRKGAEVDYGDVKVGSVVDIDYDLDRQRCIYRVRLERTDLALHADARARAEAPFIGNVRLKIVSLGSAPAPLASADQPIRLEAGGIGAAMTDLAAATRELSGVAAVLREEMNADDANAILAKVHDVIDNVDRAAHTLPALLADLRKQTDAEVPDSLVAKVRTSADNVRDVTASLKREFDPNARATALAKVHKTLDDVNALTGDANGMVGELRPALGQVMGDVAATTKAIRAYTEKDVAGLLKQLREVNSRILQIAADFTEVSEQSRQIMVLNRDNVDQIIDDMASVTGNLNALSKEVLRNPWRLFYRPGYEARKTQDIYAAARNFAEGARQLDQATSKLKRLQLQYPEGIDPNDPELPRIRDELKRSFGRFTKVEEALWRELQK
jgi:ABC-type transporter Mla subunit MlaD